MSATPSLPLASAAEALRADFDRRFAEAPAPPPVETETLLILHAGKEAYAVRLAGLLGIFRDAPVLCMPSTVASFVGVTRIGRTVAPTYDLRVLLGQPAGLPARWLILSGARTPVAFAFDAFERQVRVRAADLLVADTADTHPFIRGAFREDSAHYPLLHLPSLVESLERAA